MAESFYEKPILNSPYEAPQWHHALDEDGHSIRKMLGLLGEQLCQTPEQMKAWSQNLGHDKVLTTLSSHGQVPESRQREILSGMAVRRLGDPNVELAVRRIMQEVLKPT